ncbi:hypothetical protein ACFYNL_19730 [Streptomyces sp. NPDC007808]|uniref:hypothetical protein n=1 Tax=Streptomyces sp. NPDC007808 TaxID=3364779 RepID=UPI003698DCE2
MPVPLDHECVRAAARAADRPTTPPAAGPDEEPAGVPPRGPARRVKALVAAYRFADSARARRANPTNRTTAVSGMKG